MSSPVEKIKEHLDIAEVVGAYVTLEKAGANFKARCPFHNEKTPSFFVSPGRQSFYCFGCFPPGQLVKTPFGYHAIETLDANHYVYSGQGNIQKILGTQFRNYEGNLIDVRVQKLGGVVSLTEDHNVSIVRPKTKYARKQKQFYRQLRGYQTKHETSIYDREHILKYADIIKVPAGQIRDGDFVHYPIPTAITDIKKIDLSQYLTKAYKKGPKVRDIPYIIPVDESLLKLISYYVAEGSSHRAYIRFSLGNHEEDFAQEIVCLIRGIFGLEAKIHRREGPRTGIEITACHSYLANIFANLCGKQATEKHLPFIFQELPPHQGMIIVNAIEKGDGYTFIPRLSKNSSSVVKVVSRVLVEQITDILLRNNIFPSVWISPQKVDGRDTNHQESYSVKWSSTAKVRHSIAYEDGNSTYWILPVRSAKKRAYAGPVYNLTVDKDHTFIATNFAVSNCGAKGDIFSFVEQFEGVDFKGALKTLATRAGVELVPEKPEVKNERDRLYHALESATQFFAGNLARESRAKEYLKKRGLTDATIESWRLGFVREDWRQLHDHLKKLGFTEKEMLKAGLIKQSVKEGKTVFYDTFRGRIIFPIFDSSGRVIAFSGRIFEGDESTAKYLNSPDGPLFNKSDVLYGFDRAKLSIRPKDYAILVEGQMDLLMAQQAGYQNTVATSGTALTEGHLERLRKLSANLIMAYDGDDAGLNASKRGFTLALALGMNVRVAEFPEGMDPADLIQKDVKAWHEALKNSKHIIDIYTDRLVKKESSPFVLGKAIVKEVLPFVKKVQSAVTQANFISRIAHKTKLREDALWEELRKMPNEAISAISSKNHGGKEELPKTLFLERKIWGLLEWAEEKKIADVNISSLRGEFDNVLGERKKEVVDVLKKVADDVTFEAEATYSGRDGKDISKVLKEMLINLEMDYLKEEYARAMHGLSRAEAGKDEQKTKELLKQCHDLSQRLSMLKGSL